MLQMSQCSTCLEGKKLPPGCVRVSEPHRSSKIVVYLVRAITNTSTPMNVFFKWIKEADVTCFLLGGLRLIG